MFKMHRTNQPPCLGTIAVAALVGGLVGAVVGLMVAPKSGKELRQGFQEKTDNVLERVEVTDLAVKGKKLAADLQTFVQQTLKNKRVDTTQVTQSEELLQPIVVHDSIKPEPPLQETNGNT